MEVLRLSSFLPLGNPTLSVQFGVQAPKFLAQAILLDGSGYPINQVADFMAYDTLLTCGVQRLRVCDSRVRVCGRRGAWLPPSA